MDDSKQSKPDWWEANERLRAEMGLSAYDPPRFVDGVYTHRVVERLERECECVITFIGANVRYREDWEVQIDGETAFTIGRHRNDNGNTIYEVPSDAFREAVERALDRTGDDPGAH